MALGAIFFIVGVLVLIYHYLIYPAFLSPLSRIPNAHFTSPFSPCWILWKRYSGSENSAIHSAHQRLGQIVRLGPYDLSVNCVDGGIRTIYAGGFEKHSWYPNMFHNYGTPNMFSTAESKPHSVRKRMISNVYSKSYLQSSPDFYKLSQSIIFEVLLPLLDTLAESKTPIDVHELNFAVTMDFISAYLFGLGNGSNFLQDAETRRNLLSKYRSRRSYDFFPQELPRLYSSLRLCGIPIVPQWVYKATEEVETWCIRMCKAAEFQDRSQSYSIEEGRKPSDAVVYNRLDRALASTVLKGQSPVSDHPLMDVKASEMLDHLAAGHETSGITLTYLLHELSQRSDLQGALRAELLTLESPLRLNPTGNPEGLPALPSPRSIDALPLLDAVLMETLRLHAAIPGPQPRVTPIGLTTLVGYKNIPAGVRVSAQPYSLHRNPEVFPEPSLWKPERWLDADSAQKEEMMRWFWAFGSGGRMCIGNHFAMQEMKLLATAIYTNFATEIEDDVGIEHIDAYVAGPKSNRLMLRFERL